MVLGSFFSNIVRRYSKVSSWLRLKLLDFYHPLYNDTNEPCQPQPTATSPAPTLVPSFLPLSPPIAEEKEDDDAAPTPDPIPNRQNFRELPDSEAKNEENEDKNYCHPADKGGSAPRFLDPFKLVTDKLGKKKKTCAHASDDEIRIACVDRVEMLANRGRCKNLLGGEDLKCDCLSIFKHDFES